MSQLAEPIDFLARENHRNKQFTRLYTDMIAAALKCDNILIAHHLNYKVPNPAAAADDELIAEEIPSADTLIFDHCLMQRIFGGEAIALMTELAGVPVEGRDAALAKRFYGRSGEAIPVEILCDR